MTVELYLRVQGGMKRWATEGHAGCKEIEPGDHGVEVLWSTGKRELFPWHLVYRLVYEPDGVTA
jgi:hypothetical protein